MHASTICAAAYETVCKPHTTGLTRSACLPPHAGVRRRRHAIGESDHAAV